MKKNKVSRTDTRTDGQRENRIPHHKQILRGYNDFSDQFRKIIIRYKRIGYKMNVMRQTACLVG